MSGPFRLSARFHLALTYLVIIWVTLGLLMVFLSQYLETTAVGSRLSYLYAQAHLLVSAVEARGGPAWGVMRDVGGVPARGRVLLVGSDGRTLDDSASDDGYRGKDLHGIAEVAAALSGRQMANTYYLPGDMFTAYVAVPAAWRTGDGGAPGLDGAAGLDDVGGVEGVSGADGAGGTTAAAGPGGAVFITQDLSDIVAQHRSTMGVVLWGGAGASLLALAIAWALSSTILGPVLELSGVARRMASGRLDLRVTPRGPRETRELAESFNYMASGIEKTMSAHEEFLLAAAHELRSPLAAMQATVESMEIQEPKPDEMPAFFGDMRGELARLIHTTEEILDLLRLRGQDQVKNEMVDAVELVRQLVAGRQRTAGARSIHLEFREPVAVDGSAAQVSASPAILRLVAANLLDNALKFTTPGGQVTVEASVSGRDFTVRVTDTGPGIPAAELPRIFERFYRVDRARQRSTGGAGLGLAIVKEACERSGGTVTVESEEGKGSTFIAVWPGAVLQTCNTLTR